MGLSQSLVRQNTRKLITITEVNTVRQIIYGIDSLYNDYVVSWYAHGAVVITPQVGERWIITRNDDEWELLKRHEVTSPLVRLNQLVPGDRRLEASNILYLGGATVVLRGNATLDKDLQMGAGLSLGLLESSNINVQGDEDQLVIQGFSTPQRKLILAFDEDKEYATINAWHDPNVTDEDHAQLLEQTDLLARNIVLAELGGLIGIGKAPSYALDVEGDVNITGDFLVNGTPLDTGGGGEDLATQAELDAHIADTTNIHGITDTSVLATDSDVSTAVSSHNVDTTGVHGIADTANLVDTADLTTALSPIETDIDGLNLVISNHISDTTDAHDASAISYLGSTNLTANNVEAALDELDTEKANIAQEAWTPVTYNTGWQDYNPNFFGGAFFKDTLGIVHLRGLVARASGTETTIFTLPSGYRTSLDMMFNQAYFDGTATFTSVQVRINDTGTVVMTSPATIGAAGYISLDGISFRV